MENNKKRSKIGPVCLTIMAVGNFGTGLLALPSGLGVFALVTAALCALGAILSWSMYFRRAAQGAGKK